MLMVCIQDIFISRVRGEFINGQPNEFNGIRMLGQMIEKCFVCVGFVNFLHFNYAHF